LGGTLSGDADIIGEDVADVLDGVLDGVDLGSIL
jgi:hypothetical protein